MKKATEIKIPSDMTDTEKQHRKCYLECKYFDITTAASVLLETEMERTGLSTNSELCEGIKQLRLLESRATILQQEYDTKSTQQIVPLLRGFEHQRTELMRQHEQERATIAAMPEPLPTNLLQTLKERQETELNNLIQTQERQKESFLGHLKFDLDLCRRNIFAMFMRYVNQMYK